jgi:hypothetical protein
MRGTADQSETNLIFVCPKTDLKVQYRLERVSAVDHEYEAVICPACARLHFLNRKTGRLLGHASTG